MERRKTNLRYRVCLAYDAAVSDALTARELVHGDLHKNVHLDSVQTHIATRTAKGTHPHHDGRRDGALPLHHNPTARLGETVHLILENIAKYRVRFALGALSAFAIALAHGYFDPRPPHLDHHPLASPPSTEDHAARYLSFWLYVSLLLPNEAFEDSS